MEVNLYTFTSYAVYGVLNSSLALSVLKNTDERAFSLFEREFKSYLPSINHVGYDFYTQKEAKQLLKHIAKVADYEDLDIQ